jgi:hypothetical protein
MNRSIFRTAPFFSGLVVNAVLELYVYFWVDGGPTLLKSGGDWVAILNEIPGDLVTFVVTIVLPYLMIWAQHDPAKVSSAGKAMLATTLLSAMVIIVSDHSLVKVLAMDIGWVVLWFTAFYFLMVKNSNRIGRE